MAYFYRPFFLYINNLQKDMSVSYTVTQINNNIDNLIKQKFSDIYTEGEISSFNISPSGHSYFTLKDDLSELSCVMFKSDLLKNKDTVKVGDYVSCYGTLGLYKPKGQFQYRVSTIKPKGKGTFWENFQKLKEKLSKEGLFDTTHKIPIPKFIKNIFLVTSLNGVVKDDIIKIIRSRATYQKINIFPVTVQGTNAAKEISSAINDINENFSADLIIVARGGGSIEDLWPFNEEIVARSIYNSKIPLISAIGHETDYTISDFVSDARASTPSDAAEMVSINQSEMLQYLDELSRYMNNTVAKKISRNKDTVSSLCDKKVILDPVEGIKIIKNNVYDRYRYLNIYLNNNIDKIKSKLKLLDTGYNSINPYNVLNRGYTFLLNKDRENVSSIDSTDVGEHVFSLHTDGELKLEVLEKNEKRKRKK